MFCNLFDHSYAAKKKKKDNKVSSNIQRVISSHFESFTSHFRVIRGNETTLTSNPSNRISPGIVVTCHCHCALTLLNIHKYPSQHFHSCHPPPVLRYWSRAGPASSVGPSSRTSTRTACRTNDGYSSHRRRAICAVGRRRMPYSKSTGPRTLYIWRPRSAGCLPI